MKRELIVGGALAATCLVAIPAAAHAAPTTCNEKPVTIVASPSTLQGTEGDDVVVMELGERFSFDALGGNDTICLTLGTASDGGLPSGELHAGPGDDTVISLLPPNTKSAEAWVDLGFGNDTFVGANAGEIVEAEPWIDDLNDPHRTYPELVGAQKDIISGAETVYTTAPEDGPNQDQITFTGATATAAVSGPMAGEGLLDFRAAGESSLWVSTPARLDPQAVSLLVNNTTHTIGTNNATALTWGGEVQSFKFGAKAASPNQPGPAMWFFGTDSAEELTFEDTPVEYLSLAGGADRVAVDSDTFHELPFTFDGGTGKDYLRLNVKCKELEIQIDNRSQCDDTKVEVDSAERIDVTSPGRIMLFGTKKGEVLSASGKAVLVEARGGADEIKAEGTSSTVVKGGSGPDRIRVNGPNTLAHGDRGPDNILLGSSTSARSPKTSRRMLLGGPGDDKLYGSKSNLGDHILGGPGKDVADGRQGSRDYCLAEVRRNCELPRE